jgi:hypothetical protein
MARNDFAFYCNFFCFLDAIFEALKMNCHRRVKEYDLVTENNELFDKVLELETKIDMLSDRESTWENRVGYWRKMFIAISRKYKRLERRHANCPKKSIILYR